ncbi:structural maintenance of chromosomes-like protein [Perilla frutescens var. hirtella]|uniref:Structural maintenance of chromosomes-like protein n=1 Tax=Perilla frutescens var. hirtella TaxID=608512 RepID=A0AAD4ITI0_PERFH|nr:structural maintenance of chromosomes-like protein [Perilla frutescens var. frutescens]KAH6821267.1 structural maintenance of chromosomes-like protein [Perilla frutescens var. hirtella]
METSCAYARCTSFTRWKELSSSSCSLSAAQFSAMPQYNAFVPTSRKPWQHTVLPVVAVAKRDFRGNVDQDADTVPSTSEGSSGKPAKGSGTTARGRRLLKVREEKRKRDHERLHNYPAWAKVLEDACKNDSELRAVLGDSIGNPDLMRKKVEERVRTRGRDFTKAKSGSVLAFKVTFRDFNPLGSNIWFELFGSPTDRDVDLLGSVIQSWYVMGRLGAFNSANLQLASSSMEYDPIYDADKGSKVMPSSFHDISDVEFQDNWGRVWVDMGTADFFSIDVLLNCLTVLSSEYLGIQQVVFGGRRMGDWEEGMTSPEFGYKSFKI